MICNFCEMGVVENDRCTMCGKRPKRNANQSPAPVPDPEPLPRPTGDLPKNTPKDPRAMLREAYDQARAAADAVNDAHAIYVEKRRLAEAAAQRYLAMREAYVGEKEPGKVPDDPTEPDAAPQVRCRHCSELLPVPLPVRCTHCGRITSDPKERAASRPCPTCGTPNPPGREECYACYHPMQA